MGDSLLFLSSIIGIAWLCLWAIRSPDAESKAWWPFDYLGQEDDQPTTPRHRRVRLRKRHQRRPLS